MRYLKRDNMHKIHDNLGSTFRTCTTAVHIEQHMHKEWGKLCMTGLAVINPDSFSLFPKNPKIAAFFREVGRADKLGSDVRNIFKYTLIYSKGVKPELIEGDVFRITIPLAPYGEEGNVSDRETNPKILEMIKENPEITRKELAELIGITDDGVKYHLTKLKKQEKIKRIGLDKGGHWEVVE